MFCDQIIRERENQQELHSPASSALSGERHKGAFCVVGLTYLWSKKHSSRLPWIFMFFLILENSLIFLFVF